MTSSATWWSADPTIAEFDPAVPGRLVAKSAGTVRIEARIDGAAEPAEVTVSSGAASRAGPPLPP